MKFNGMIILALLFLFACTKEKQSIDQNERYTIYKFKNSTFFLDNSDSITYFIQYENSSTVSNIKVSSISYAKNNSITATSELNKISTFKLDGNIFGFGKYKGIDHKMLKIEEVENRSNAYYYDYSWLDEPTEIFAVKCNCLKNGTKPKGRVCDSGGEGSTQCGITDAGGVGTVNWNNQCETTCSAGNYACCSKE